MPMDYESKKRLSKNILSFKKSSMGKKPGAVMALRKHRLPDNVQGKSFMQGMGVMKDQEFKKP